MAKLAEKPSPELVYLESGADLSGANLAKIDDRSLVALTVAGEDRAFAELMDRYLPMVVGFLYGKTDSEGDAEDLGQDIFLKAFRNLPYLRNPDRLGAWLMRITRTRLIDYYRSKSRQPKIVRVGDRFPDTDDDPLTWVPDPSGNPGQRAVISQSHSIALEEIGRMGDTYQPILFMRLVGDCRTGEIARRLSLKEGTVRARLSRGLKLLRAALKKRGVISSGAQ